MHTTKTQRGRNKLTNVLKNSGYVYTEGEMVGWHHRLNGHEFEQTPGDSEGDRETWHAAVGPGAHKDSDKAMMEQQQQCICV